MSASTAKIGRPKKETPPAKALMVACTDRRGQTTTHKMSSELTPREAAERLGVYGRTWTVSTYPEGSPEQAVPLQTFDGKDLILHGA